jgi:hypothetical protein
MLEMPQMVQTWKEVSFVMFYIKGNGANISCREVMVVDGRSGRRNREVDIGCIIVGMDCISIIRSVERMHTIGVRNKCNCTSSLLGCLAFGKSKLLRSIRRFHCWYCNVSKAVSTFWMHVRKQTIYCNTPVQHHNIHLGARLTYPSSCRNMTTKCLHTD